MSKIPYNNKSHSVECLLRRIEIIDIIERKQMACQIFGAQEKYY